jgi:predicted metal-dependent hydrolase
MKTPSITIQPYPTARSLKMKFCPYRRFFVVTTPKYIRQSEVDRFIKKSEGWMEKQLAKHPEVSPIKAGETLSVLGDSYRLLHDPLRRKGIFEEGDVLWIGGKEETLDLQKYLILWLKKRAQHFFLDYARMCAEQMGVSFQKIRLTETISRWGSCSSQGTLSLNWRLILAPLDVAEYVVAHEVCHLREMNHSQKFWSLVKDLCPDFEKHRHWLKKHGTTLYQRVSLREG